MLIPDRKLKFYESHYWDADKTINKNTYDNETWDDLTIVYFKIGKTFFGKLKEITWEEKYSFKRVTTPTPDKQGYVTVSESTDAFELRRQLEDFKKQQLGGRFITDEDYEFFKEQFPERFI